MLLSPTRRSRPQVPHLRLRAPQQHAPDTQRRQRDRTSTAGSPGQCADPKKTRREERDHLRYTSGHRH